MWQRSSLFFFRFLLVAVYCAASVALRGNPISVTYTKENPTKFHFVLWISIKYTTVFGADKFPGAAPKAQASTSRSHTTQWCVCVCVCQNGVENDEIRRKRKVFVDLAGRHTPHQTVKKSTLNTQTKIHGLWRNQYWRELARADERHRGRQRKNSKEKYRLCRGAIVTGTHDL